MEPIIADDHELVKINPLEIDLVSAQITNEQFLLNFKRLKRCARCDFLDCKENISMPENKHITHMSVGQSNVEFEGHAGPSIPKLYNITGRVKYQRVPGSFETVRIV